MQPRGGNPRSAREADGLGKRREEEKERESEREKGREAGAERVTARNRLKGE